MLGTKWRSRIEDIDQKILLHEKQIALLRSERKFIAQDLDAIVYPVLTLPSEITAEIFIQYVESHPTRNPLRLTWVCQSWRAVATSTCRLWTLCMNFHTGRAINPASALPVWLSRAGGLPLNLEFHLTYLPPQDSQSRACVESLYETVSRFASQLESLTLSSFDCISLPARCFPRLKRLAISDGPLVNDIIPRFDTHLDAPCLREVVLKDESVIKLQTALPNTQLTTLELETDVANCLVILAHTPNLQELEIWCDYFGNPNPTFTTLPHLRSIRLGRHASVDIIPYLTLPALERLDISVDSGMDRISSFVNDLVARSGCTLRQLNLSLRHADGGWLSSFLDSVPLSPLQKLTLRAPDGDLGLLLRYIAESRLPALESLEIHDCQFHVRLAELVDTLATRIQEAPGVAPLKSFQLSFGMADSVGRSGDVELKPSCETDQEVKDALDKLRDLRAQGLRVDIRSDFETLSFGNIDSRIIELIHTDEER